MSLKSFVILLFGVLLLSACELQHRRYRSGFYSNWNNKQNENIDQQAKKILQKNSQEKSLTQNPSKNIHQSNDSCDVVEFTDGTKIKLRIKEANERELKYVFCEGDESVRRVSRKQVLNIWYADGRREGPAASMPVIVAQPIQSIQPIPEERKDSVQVKSNTDTTKVLSNNNGTTLSIADCDKITLRNGDEIQAKVIEIGIKDIRYKRCDMLDGPVFVQPKNTAFMIIYANGHKDVFKEEETQTAQSQSQYDNYSYTKPKRGLATWAFVCAMVGIYPLILIGSIAGLIMGSIYLYKYNIQPEIYDRQKMAKSAVIISAVTLGIYILVLIMGNI